MMGKKKRKREDSISKKKKVYSNKVRELYTISTIAATILSIVSEISSIQYMGSCSTNIKLIAELFTGLVLLLSISHCHRWQTYQSLFITERTAWEYGMIEIGGKGREGS